MGKQIKGAFRIAKGVAIKVTTTVKDRVKLYAEAFNATVEAQNAQTNAFASMMALGFDSYASARSEGKEVSHADGIERFNDEVEQARALLVGGLTGKDRDSFNGPNKEKPYTTHERKEAASAGKLTEKALSVHRRILSSYVMASNVRSVLNTSDAYPDAIAEHIDGFYRQDADGNRKVSPSELRDVASALKTSKGKSATRTKAKADTPVKILRATITRLQKIGKNDLALALVKMAASHGVKGLKVTTE